VDPDKPAMILVVDDNLKDKAPFKEMAVNLTGDQDAKKDNHRDVLLKRVAKDVVLVVFVVKTKGDDYLAFVFTNGTWFQMSGDKDRWQFNHCEPALRGTYKETTEELKKLVADVLADPEKNKAPAPNP